MDRSIFIFWESFFLSACEALTEWEYLPPVGPRPSKGFVGLKNAGATCYMNSVIQQLYMIPSIRNSILAVEGTGSDVDDDIFGDEKQDSEVNFNYTLLTLSNEVLITRYTVLLLLLMLLFVYIVFAFCWGFCFYVGL